MPSADDAASSSSFTRHRSTARAATWRPATSRQALCVFTAAVGEAVQLLTTIQHNANWAVAHGASFTLFSTPMARNTSNSQWEKVLAARHMLHSTCDWLMHIDADAVVADVDQSPEQLLQRLKVDALPAEPLVFASCNSPLGRPNGMSCDTFCCARARDGDACTNRRTRPASCTVGLHDVGDFSPYPCMINSGVWFMKGGEESRRLVKEWEEMQDVHPEIFGEQASLNELKEKYPSKIDVVGGHVMNTYASFHRRMLRTELGGHVAYDLAMRVTSGYEPEVWDDTRLNQTLYAAVAQSYFGVATRERFKETLLRAPFGECGSDRSAFVCHPFAEPLERKQALGEHVARDRRPRLEQLLRSQQQLGFRSFADVQQQASGGDGGAAPAGGGPSHRKRQDTSTESV